MLYFVSQLVVWAHPDVVTEVAQAIDVLNILFLPYSPKQWEND